MASRLPLLASVSAVSLLAAPALAQSDPVQATERNTTAATTPDANAQDASSQDIVVTGVRASIVGAINRRRNSTQIVDSVVAEDVGKLPDNNVVEALQRVTGVQVTDRGQGEAAGIQIRGLPDALTTLNGRNIFTAAGQSFSLQDVSANLIKRVDV